MSTRKIFIYAAVPILLLTAYIFITYLTLAQAETAWQDEDYLAAAASYARAAQLRPWRNELWEKAGLSASNGQDFHTAIEYFTRAELSADGQFALAYCYYQIGDIANAQKTFEQGAEIYQTPQFYKGLAFLHRSEKKWDEEKSALEKQIRMDVGDAYAHYRLGVLLSVLDSELALPELMLASSLDPATDPAVQTLRAALNLSATQPDASRQMVTIGRALGLIEEWELAAAAFEKALALDEKNSEAWAWLGEAKQQMGDDGRAELERALTLGHTSPTVRALRGLYWTRAEKYPQALAEYLLAVEYEPQNPAWQASLGGAYVKYGDLISALAAYQRATELAPNESEYWRLLAVFCADNGIHVEEIGLPAAKTAVQIAPNDPLALDALGWSYFSSNRYANAEQTLRDVIARFPEYYPARIHLALTYFAQGNHGAAAAELDYVRAADKGGEDGARAESLLQKYFP